MAKVQQVCEASGLREQFTCAIAFLLSDESLSNMIVFSVVDCLCHSAAAWARYPGLLHSAPSSSDGYKG